MSTDRHKDRGLDVSVGSSEDAGAAATGQLAGDFVFKHACYYMLFVPREGNVLGSGSLKF